MKGLRSPFALVLSGTPLENRLDELFSVAEFIDERKLVSVGEFEGDWSSRSGYEAGLQIPLDRSITAIVVANYGTSLDVIDCNWVGSENGFHYVLGRHTFSSSTLNSWGFRAYNPWANPILVP